ncbi:MAG: ATP-dependent DNA helicase RecG, partial [Shimia sp.]
MAGRPPILFPLFAEITTLPGVGPKVAEALAALRITRPRDLPFHLPHTVIDRRPRATIQGADLPATLTAEVEIVRHHAPGRKGAPYRVTVEDAQLAFQLVWFRPQVDWITRTLPVGARRIVSGKVEAFEGLAQMVHPDHILPPEEAAALPPFEPVYPTAAGLAQKTLVKALTGAMARMPDDLEEWIDAEWLRRQEWPAMRAALEAAHAPDAVNATAPTAPARARLAYDEVFA